MPHQLGAGDHETFDVLTNQTQASQEYATAILVPCALGWMGQIALWGMALAVFAGYLRTELYARDSKRRKALLWVVMAVTTMQAVLNFFCVCYWMVRQDRDAASLLHPTVPDAMQPLSIAINGPLVQGFLAIRATRLITLRWLKYAALVYFGILISLEFYAILFAAVLNILFHQHKLSGTLLEAATYGLISGIWLVLAAATDVSISVLLVAVLRRRIAGFNASTDGRLRALCRLAIQSASYTAVVAVAAALLTYCSPSDNLLWACAPYALWWLLSSCYALALLSTLSSRALILRKNPTGQPTLPTISSCGGAPPSSATACGPGGAAAAAEREQRRRSASPLVPKRLLGSRPGSAGGCSGGIQVAQEVTVHVDEEDEKGDEDALSGGRRGRRIELGAD
ncbi:hypothetical protein JCM10450v2_005755 [Rhodotorula kratochvilovae]